MKDIPPEPMRYQREGILPKEALEPLVYAEPNPIGDDDIYEEVDAYNVRVIGVFTTWNQDELEEVEEGNHGH